MIRKLVLRTQDSFVILARYKDETEQIDEADTLAAAEYLAREYQLAFSGLWTVWIEIKNSEREA